MLTVRPLMFSTTPSTFNPVFRQKLISLRTSAIATSCGGYDNVSIARKRINIPPDAARRRVAIYVTQTRTDGRVCRTCNTAISLQVLGRIPSHPPPFSTRDLSTNKKLKMGLDRNFGRFQFDASEIRRSSRVAKIATVKLLDCMTISVWI